MKVLVINPGATSTKVAVFDEETQAVSYTHLTLPTMRNV